MYFSIKNFKNNVLWKREKYVTFNNGAFKTILGKTKFIPSQYTNNNQTLEIAIRCIDGLIHPVEAIVLRNNNNLTLKEKSNSYPQQNIYSKPPIKRKIFYPDKKNIKYNNIFLNASSVSSQNIPSDNNISGCNEAIQKSTDYSIDRKYSDQINSIRNNNSNFDDNRPEKVKETIFYQFDVVVKTGEDELVEIEKYPSINDNGIIAFVGRVKGSDGRLLENLYSWEDISPHDVILRPLFNTGLLLPKDGDDPTMTFGPEVIINNKNEVLAMRYLRAIVQIGPIFGKILTAPLTYLETWDAQVANQHRCKQLAMGHANATALVNFLNPLWAGPSIWSTNYPDLINLPSAFDLSSPFSIVFNWANINNHNQFIFNAMQNGEKNLVTKPNIFVGSKTEDKILKPSLADNGNFVVKAGTSINSGIWLMPYNFDFNQRIIIADPSNYAAIGSRPVISDDGHVAVFIADMDSSKNRRIYISSDLSMHSFKNPFPVAGISGNGIIDPGETFEDLNNNNIFDKLTNEKDIGIFESIELESPIGVAKYMNDNNVYTVVFIARRLERKGHKFRSRRGLYSIDIDLDNPNQPCKRYGKIVEIGDCINIYDSANNFTGEVEDFWIHDPINNLGHTVFWVKTANNTGIIRARSMRGLEILDYNFSAFWMYKPEMYEYTLLSSTGAKEVKGFVADGVTKLLLRTPTFTKRGKVTIEITPIENNSVDPHHVGSLCNALNQNQTGNPLVVSLEQNPYNKSEYKGFALLTSPIDFVRKDQAEDLLKGFYDPRKINIKTSYTFDDGEIIKSVQKIELHRPPVILLHGLHSKRTPWKWKVINDPRFFVEIPDYELSNGDSFIDNVPKVRKFISDAIHQLRYSNIAATQADVFGHSMGGLLLRLYSTNELDSYKTNFIRRDNFEQGDIHKLITVNTPHYGSQVSTLMVDYDNNETYSGWIGRLFSKYWDKEIRCMNCGAVRDLRPDSEILRLLNSKKVSLPVHAFYGVNGDSADSPSGYGTTKRNLIKIGGLAALKCIDYKPSNLFFGTNDAVVSAVSQRGGLHDDAVTIAYGGNGLHSPTVLEYIDGVSSIQSIELLNASISDSIFADGFPTRLDYPLIPIPNECSLSVNQAKLLNIFLDKMVYLSGEVVEIMVEIIDDFNPLEKYIVISGEGMLPIVPTMQSKNIDKHYTKADSVVNSISYTFQIPKNYLGTIIISAYGINPDNKTIGYSEDVEIDVSTLESVEKIDVSPKEIFLYDFCSSQNLKVDGIFSDGIERDITHRERGTLYSSDNPEIAIVSNDGLVIAKSVGRTYVTASNNDLSAKSEIVVFGVSQTNTSLRVEPSFYSVTANSGRLSYTVFTENNTNNENINWTVDTKNSWYTIDVVRITDHKGFIYVNYEENKGVNRTGIINIIDETNSTNISVEIRQSSGNLKTPSPTNDEKKSDWGCFIDSITNF